MHGDWDCGINREFVKEIKEKIKELMEDYGTDDPYEIAEDIGRELLNIIYETYGSPDEW